MSDEQQQEATQSGETQMSERDALIAAVREAGGTESVNVAAEEAAAAAPTETPKPAEPAPADEESPLDRILKQREKMHAEREAARASAQSILDNAERERQRIIEEAKAEARRAIEQEAADRRARFQRSPVEALRESGYDAQKIVDEVLQAGTPEARARRELEAKLSATEELAKEGKSAKEELERFRRELAAERQAELVAQIRTEFLSNDASAEKAPYMHARWEPAEIFDRCNALCVEWQRDGLALGKDFDRADLVQYLERQSKERVTKHLPTTQPAATSQAAGAPAKEPGNAPKVQANGPRTLSAALGSERRTSPKPLSEMSPEQQRQALIDEVAAARRNNPDSVF